MRKALLKSIAALAAVLAVTSAHAALSLNFSSMPGSTIQFNGAASSFQVNNNFAGNQWWITSEVGGVSALGLKGWFLGGPWSYGAITTSGVNQWATVTTTGGTFKIDDGVSASATGNVDWVKVATHEGIGGVNADLTVNITGMVYSGLNPDLQALVAASKGKVILSFQFNPAKTLSQLSTGSTPFTTSYSGSFTPVPEPTTLVAGACALAVLVLGAGARRKN